MICEGHITTLQSIKSGDNLVFQLMLLGCLALLGCNSEQKEPAPQKQTELAPKETNVGFPPTTPKENSVVTFDLNNPKTPDGERIESVRLDPHNPVLGNEKAPVTWVIFAGWQCPFSSKIVETIRLMHKAYPDKLRIVFKHTFPPNEDISEEIALRLSMVSPEIFWKFGLDLLEKSPISRDDLVNMPSIPELQEMDKREALIRITMDQELAKELKIRSTPQSLINGLRITGSKSPETFKKAIEEALNAIPDGATP